jgi:hypothetical protein
MRLAAVLAVGAIAAACSGDPTGVSSAELVLAQESQLIVESVADATGCTHGAWLRRLLERLRESDDPEAQAFLAQARELHALAREAREAGDLEAAREYLRQAFRAVLSAVLEVFPDAVTRTGAAVDEAITRIESHLGDREAPRIRRVIAHVRELRNAADAALAEGDQVTALALNLRGIQILYRLVNHIRDRHEHDRVADGEMEGVEP